MKNKYADAAREGIPLSVRAISEGIILTLLRSSYDQEVAVHTTSNRQFVLKVVDASEDALTGVDGTGRVVVVNLAFVESVTVMDR